MIYDFLSPFISPQNQVWIGLFLIFIAVSIAVIQRVRLMRRHYWNPYALESASANHKLIWALYMSLWDTSWLLFMNFLVFLTMPSPDVVLGFMPMCSGGWLLVIVFLVLIHIRNMDMWLKIYGDWDNEIRAGRIDGNADNMIQKFLSNHIVLRFITTEEILQFAKEGFSR